MEYETIVSEYVDYGRNKFLEISKKKVKPDETIFLNISKGFYTPEGEKRYQRGIGFPNEQEIVNNLIAKLQSVVSADIPQRNTTEQPRKKKPLKRKTSKHRPPPKAPALFFSSQAPHIFFSIHNCI